MKQSKISIRLMNASDVSGVAEFVSTTPLWQRYGVTFDSFSTRLNSGLESGASIIVAVLGSEVLGFAWASEKGAFGRDVYLPLIGVRPLERSLGVGGLLLDYVEQTLFGGPRDVFLLVSDFNLEAQRFYAKRGYTQVGAIPNYVLDGVSELLMWKKIKN